MSNSLTLKRELKIFSPELHSAFSKGNDNFGEVLESVFSPNGRIGVNLGGDSFTTARMKWIRNSEDNKIGGLFIMIFFHGPFIYSCLETYRFFSSKQEK